MVPQAAGNVTKLVRYPHKPARMYALNMYLSGRHLDWQAASAARVFHMLRTGFSALSLRCKRRCMSLYWNDEAVLTQWCKFLGSFDNLKTIHINDGSSGQLSLSLQFRRSRITHRSVVRAAGALISSTWSSPDALSPSIDGCQSRK